MVDDNAVNRLVAAATLENLGAQVELAHDGQQALDLVAANDFDAVQMDWQMPGLDGVETTGRIRAAEAQRGLERLPMLAMTASSRDDEAERALAAGMDGYLTKPMQQDQLLRELHSAQVCRTMV